jgi:hypothetical protein
MRFDVPTVFNNKIAEFWKDTVQFGRPTRFGGICCLHLQRRNLTRMTQEIMFSVTFARNVKLNKHYFDLKLSQRF